MLLRRGAGRQRAAKTKRPRSSIHFDTLECRTLLAFGLATTATSFTVDTGAQVVFSVTRAAGGSGSIGDLNSFKYNGIEFEAPFASTSRFSHYESGLSSATVVTATVDPAGNWIKIACDDTAAGGVGVIHYYIARKDDNNIYMATYAPGPSSPSPGEMRFITYLNWNIFTNHPNPSDTSAIHGVAQTAIESSDVFRDPVDLNTHSKYYGESRAIDSFYHGATGGGAGAVMFMGNRESSSGGPFFKDIDFQSTGASVELYNYMFSGHSQTENFRPGLQGPYALQLTGGSAPTAPDYSFLDGVGLAGWVSPSGRGALAGIASGVPAGRAVTVGLSNSTAQYWAKPDAAGHYSITGIKPGTYVETLYQDELAVGTQTVTISASQTTAANIVETYYLPTAIWRIGTWDGTPIGFLNADKIQDMHPSDTRMTPWVNTIFTVGSSTDASWPMAEWKDATLNPLNTISFDLTAAQAATPMTLRIGLTRTGVGGRTIVSVNGGANSAAPSPPSEPSARGVTLGNWRGNNVFYTYSLAGLHAGTNTVAISVASGSSGSTFLSPWVIFDAIDLVPTANITNAPVVTTITLSPPNPTLGFGAGQIFTATARDQFGNVMPANFTWSAARGLIDGTGSYIAPGTPGGDTVTVISGAKSGSTSANIVDDTPVEIGFASFNFQTSQSLTFQFNKMDISDATPHVDMTLQNLTTGAAAVPFTLTYSSFNGTFTPSAILSDGDYRAIIPADSVQDSFGNHMPADYTFDFFVLAGDANRDRVVDINDFNALASHYGRSTLDFAKGDFNYDGVINSVDLGILASHWQTADPDLAALIASVTHLPTRAATRVARQVL